MSIVSFASCGPGREVAKLGTLEIGYVMAVTIPRNGTQFQWRTQLGFNAAQLPKVASSASAAKRALVYRVAELFECAGNAFEAIAHAARAQADGMERV